MQSEPSQADPDYDKQAEQLLRSKGLTADVQPKGMDARYRRLVTVAIIFVIFCLAITMLTYLAD